ncbi:MAG: flagellar export protein FliJ [Burkholderiales bacterium]|jgi:flagellar FliJ protein|nr:flagellar export protein FliJ [Burkholderiales bacterium]
MSNTSANGGLQAARDLALRQRDEAAARLAAARQAWMGAQQQLDQLQGYAHETDARWAPGGAGGACTPEVMRHHYQFMQRLGHAIALQSGAVDGQARRVEEHAGLLRSAEARLESLQQVLARRDQQLAREARRREQKATDEMAALQYRKQLRGQLAGGV